MQHSCQWSECTPRHDLKMLSIASIISCQLVAFMARARKCTSTKAAQRFERLWRNESCADVADSRTERVGKTGGERTRERSTAQYTTYTRHHGNYHTGTSDTAVPSLPILKTAQFVPHALCSMWETKRLVYRCCRCYEKCNASNKQQQLIFSVCVCMYATFVHPPEMLSKPLNSPSLLQGISCYFLILCCFFSPR